MKVTVKVDGQPVDHELTAEVGDLTLRQSVILEKTIGAQRMAQILKGNELVAALPSTMQAMIYAQLVDEFPDLSIDDFDMSMDEFAPADEEAEDDGGGVVLPMELPDGTTTEGVSVPVDPTPAAAAAD